MLNPVINYFHLMLGAALIIIGTFALSDSARGFTRVRRGGEHIPFENFRNPKRVKAIAIGGASLALGLLQIALAFVR